MKALRRYQIPHNEEMARVLEAEIHSSADLDLLIHHLPPELIDADASALGDPALMSPEAVQAWIQKLKTEASASLKKA